MTDDHSDYFGVALARVDGCAGDLGECPNRAEHRVMLGFPDREHDQLHTDLVFLCAECTAIVRRWFITAAVEDL